jgi:putative tryptophan/tyrosine transport system substrate-binding protein
MRRREFLCVLAGVVTAWPLTGHTQKPPVGIGLLASGAAGSIYSNRQIDAINQGLRDMGLIEGRDYVIEPRFASGNFERFPELARELAEARVRVILTNTIASVRAAQGLNPPIPVIMLSINDPVGAKLVAALSKPGGYTTGLANLNEDLTNKLLEFQRAVIPNAATIAGLYNPSNPTNPVFLAKLRTQAGAFGMKVLSAELKMPGALDATFAELAAQRPDALHIMSDSGIFDLSDRIAALSIAHRTPSFATYPDFAALGGLIAYGASRQRLFVRSGYFVKRILDGASPGDLPVEQPTRVELAINLRTAKILGLEIPQSLLTTAGVSNAHARPAQEGTEHRKAREPRKAS